MSQRLLPYGRQHIDQKDIDAVVAVLKSDFLTCGKATESFEATLSSKINVKDTVTCSSGTAALHLTSLGLGLGEGPADVAIIPAMTFSATANAPFMVGTKIVFSDVNPQTGLMEASHLEEAFARAQKIGTPKAVFPVHLNGQLAPLAEISAFAKEHNLYIIEDACHAIGGQYLRQDVDGREGWGNVGDCALSDATCFSFHPVKTIAMGEGGAISSQNSDLLSRMRMLRSHGITRDQGVFQEEALSTSPSGAQNPWYYEMQQLGNNYRSSDIHCALGESQLKKLDIFIEKRRVLFSHYRARLVEGPDTLKMLELMENQKPAWHLMVVLIDFEKADIDRATVMQKLRAKNIFTQVHYIPVPWQPFWKENSETPDLPGARSYYERALSLPLFYDMNFEDVDFVCDTLLDILAK